MSRRLGSHLTAGRYDDAIATLNPHFATYARRAPDALNFLAAAYAATGQDEKAGTAMKALLDKRPGRTLKSYRYPRLYKRTENRDRLLNLQRVIPGF